MSTTYKIGEAAALLNLKSYVLRFWETEFPDITPLRTEKGQRLYTVDHLALLQRIRYLLHDRGLTISGARKVLAEERQRGEAYIFQQPGEQPAALLFDEGRSCGSPPEGSPPEGSPPEGSPPEFAGQDKKLKDGAGCDIEPLESVSAAPCDTGPKPFCQHSLPGLDRLMVMRASALDSREGEGYFSVEQTSAQVCPGPKGMLPLFAASLTACLAGASPNRSGGEGVNFIQPGAADGAHGKNAAPGGNEQAAGPDYHALLRAVASDLESVAALLRPGATLKPLPGVSAGNLRKAVAGNLFEK